ncbi:hypothetical protein [Halovulum sp. GXIMD14793]
MREPAYRRLLQLAEIKLARDMAATGEIRARIAARQARRGNLSSQSQAEFSGVENHPATLTAFARWTEWTQQHRTQLDNADSTDTALLDDAKAKLKTSFGETRALDFLLVQEKAAARKRRAQRAERDGLPPED